jgi:drug/metabolite transporter (DMT)-like permease
VALSSLPAFEILSGIFISGFVASAAINTARQNWKSAFNRPKYLIIAGIFGIVGNDIFYILAFKHAPAVQVDLIVYLWPMMVLMLSSLVLSEEIRKNHVLACFLAFAGVCFLLFSEGEDGIFNAQYWPGYFFAFMSAVLWAIYIVISRRYIKSTPELFAIYCIVGAVFSVIMHLLFEETVIPSRDQGIILVIMGVATHGLAYFGWDYAIKRGHFKLLTILSYSNPVLSVIALIIFGFAELTHEVLIATFMVFLAGVIGGKKFRKRKLAARLESKKNNIS